MLSCWIFFTIMKKAYSNIKKISPQEKKKKKKEKEKNPKIFR